MFFCRCCLTFEDNLYPFTEYEGTFRDCTGLNVENTALICPGCIRKLNDAFAFREQSLKSDEILRKKDNLNHIEIKTEPTDEIEEEYLEETECFIADEEETEIKIKERLVPPTAVQEEKENKIERKKRRKIEKNVCNEKPKSLAHSIRAKTAWTQDAKLNLIKECPYCFLNGLPKADLMRHIQEHVIANGGLECDHCEKKFMKKRQLKRHIQRMFLGLKDGAPIGDGLTLTLTCIVSDCMETFQRKSLLRIHYRERHPKLLEQRSSSGGTNYFCSECGKKLKSKKSLESHELTHSGLRKYICPSCGRGYKTREGLKYHELAHTDQRPFTCNICGRGFKTKDNLRDHEPVHTGDLAFPCDVCGKRFRARNLLVGHRVLHDEVPKHSCDICSLKFRRANNLRDHKLIHTERRDFCCGHCGTAFKSRSSLKRHMKQHAIKMGLDENSIELRNCNGTIPNQGAGFRLEGYIVQTIQVQLGICE